MPNLVKGHRQRLSVTLLFPCFFAMLKVQKYYCRFCMFTIFPKKINFIEGASRRKRSVVAALFGIVFIALVGYLGFAVPPSAQIPYLPIPLLPVFLLLLFLALLFTGTFLFKSKSHGILIGTFVVVYLIFRLNELTHPFFFILLFALFLTLELFVSYRK